MSEVSDSISNKAILTYLQNIDRKISQLEYDIDGLKDKICDKDEIPPLSTCSCGCFAGVTDQQLDIDEKNFDKDWYFKHYKVDCPEFDQPLTIDQFRELGKEMTPEEYGKYMAKFFEEDKKTCELL